MNELYFDIVVGHMQGVSVGWSLQLVTAGLRNLRSAKLVRHEACV